MKRMKSLILITIIAIFTVGIFTTSAAANPADFGTDAYKWMWRTDWSPDGTQIAFGSGGEIMMLTIATGEVVNLTEGPEYDGDKCTYPMFSADGSKIYFSYRPREGYEFYPEDFNNKPIVVYHTDIIDIATKERTPFKKNAYAMSFSRDGRYAIYTKEGTSTAVLDMLTGEETTYDYTETDEAPFFAMGHSFFSPDASCFITTCGKSSEIPSVLEYNDFFDIYKVDRVTGETELIELGDLSYWYPRFSPDGTKLVLSQIDSYTTEYPKYPDWSLDENGQLVVDSGKGFYMHSLYVINPETGKYENMCYENYYLVEGDQKIFYIKDGDYVEIPFYGGYNKTITRKGNKFEVVIYDIETGESTTILNEGFFQSTMASWSPDGTQICYVLKEDLAGFSRSYLYIYDLDEGVHKLVVNGDTGETNPTAVEDDAPPVTFAITGNYPNPFNPTTTIEFSLEKAGDVSLDIFNVMGQKVHELESATLAPGAHSVVWDGRNDSGNTVSSGVYIVRMKMGAAIQSKPMLLTK